MAWACRSWWGTNRRRAPARAARLRRSARAADGGQARPRVRPLITENSGPTGIAWRAVSHGLSCSKPHPVVHSDLAPVAALAATNEDRPTTRVKVKLGELERFLDA
jgi:hypothetical protein